MLESIPSQQSVCKSSQGVRIDLKVDLHHRLRVSAPEALLTLDLAGLQVLNPPPHIPEKCPKFSVNNHRPSRHPAKPML